MMYVKDVRKYLFIFSPNSHKWCQTRGCCVRWIQISARNICNVICEDCLQISINIYPLFSQMVSHDMLLSVINSDFGQKSFVMLMSRCFAKLYLYLPLIFSNLVTRHVVEYDELRFQPEVICNDVWRMFANIYLYLPLSLSNSVTRHVDKFDELRLQLEFICNAYVKMFCKIVFIFTADFLKWCQTTCCWVRWTEIYARIQL